MAWQFAACFHFSYCTYLDELLPSLCFDGERIPFVVVVEFRGVAHEEDILQQCS